MDAETFIWWIVPILATIGGVVYAARKDSGIEERVRKLEQCEAHRQGSESIEQSPQPTVDPSEFALWKGQCNTNRETLAMHRSRLEALEEA